MKETTRTMIFVGAALASIALAAAAHIVSQPKSRSEFQEVGTVFYPDFTDPNEANAIKVIVFDESTAEIRTFEVRYDHGRWLIPSHHNYPADAKDRLAKTAASVIGIKRGALQSKSEAEHERFGVIDPMNTNVASLKGRGQRITLTKNDETLADFIIGKQVEGEPNTYYVREPRDNKTYRTALTIDLSTKFADWIEPDLLQVDRGDLREVVAKKFAVDQNQQIVEKAMTRLTHDPASSDWKLDGLNAETEELNADEVRKLVNSLDDLRIVGVRPKPGGLNADLTIDRSVAKDPLVFNVIDSDLRRRGFVLYQDAKKDLQLASNEGAVFAKSSQGIVYALHFGEIFTGDDKQIEVGGATDGKTENADKKDEKAGDASKTDEKKDEAKKEGDNAAKSDKEDSEKGKDGEKDKQKRSRYLFVSVDFDPKLIGEPPVKPTEPQKPPENPAEGDKKTDAKLEEKKDGAAATDKPADEKAKEAAKPAEAEDKLEGPKNPEKPKDPKAEYEAAMTKYKEDLKKYEDDLKQYDKKIADGRKKFDQLKARFGGWYYVISAESFETLKLTHADLVKPKEKKDQPAATTPTIPGSTIEPPPGLNEKPTAPAEPASPAEKPEGEAEGEKPAAKEEPKEQPAPPKEEAPKTPEATTPPAEPPAAEKKATPPAETK